MIQGLNHKLNIHVDTSIIWAVLSAYYSHDTNDTELTALTALMETWTFKNVETIQLIMTCHVCFPSDQSLFLYFASCREMREDTSRQGEER